MKRFGRARIAIAAFALSVPAFLALSGCGGETPNSPPPDVSQLKTPSEVLKEAQAKEKPNDTDAKK